MKAFTGGETGHGDVVIGLHGASWIQGSTAIELVQSDSRGGTGCWRHRTVNRSARAQPGSIPEAWSGHPRNASRPLLEMLRHARQA